MTIKTITHEISRAHTEASDIKGPCAVVTFENFSPCLPLDLLCGRGSIQEAADARARIDALLVAAGYERVDAAMLQAETYERLAEDIGQDLDWNGDQLWSGDHRRLALMTDDALYVETSAEPAPLGGSTFDALYVETSAEPAPLGGSTFGALLRQTRKDASLTQADIGKLLGVTPQAVGYWERDQSEPGRESTVALLKLLPVLATALGIPA